MIDIPIMTEQEFQIALAKRREEQLPIRAKVGMDGWIEVGKANVKYREIPYTIRLLRYYSLNGPPSKLNDAGVHAVVEHPDIDKRLFDIVLPFNEDFLYHDTLHAGQEHLTIKEHIEAAQREAEQDIDWLYEEAIREMKTKIAEQLKTIAELRKLLKEVS